jgi:uncharacterized protein
MMKNIFVGVIFLVSLYPFAVMADYQEGRDAFDRGDYSTALKKFEILAKQNNPRGQYALAVMYDIGEGVGKDYKEAMKWYLLAAKRGNKDAPNNIGVLHMIGFGVPRSFAKAYTWFSIAGAGDSEAISNKNFVKKRLTPEQLVVSQRRADEWQRIWLKK